MTIRLEVEARHIPEIDPGFLPAVLWNRAFASAVRASRGGVPLGIALVRQDGTVFRHSARILPATPAHAALNQRYVERLLKFLLWQKGGSTVLVKGDGALARALASQYSAKGARAFDRDFLGRRVFGAPIEVKAAKELPPARETQRPLGRHLDGCRIGFDLGGSDRKAAALVDGKVVFSDEVKWNPYFEKDPAYHLEGVNDSIRRAARHLPRIDAIGGSAAGVYVNSEPRVGSLYRGVSEPDFDRHIRGLFRALQQWLGRCAVRGGERRRGDGARRLDVAALECRARHLARDQHGGRLRHARRQHHAVAQRARLRAGRLPAARAGRRVVGRPGRRRPVLLPAGGEPPACPRPGSTLPAEMPLAERLVEVQALMAKGDPRARKIYEAIGVYLGYGIAHFADFYAIESVLVLGRVTSGQGGDAIVETAARVLEDEFPALAERIRLRTPDEKEKRHGQAIAAASLAVAPPRGARGARRKSAPRKETRGR